MLSVREPGRSLLYRLVARVLIAALVAASIPATASASVPAEALSLTKTAFGELIAHTGTDPQPYAFAGEPYDPNSGFQYHRARWMDPRGGRFLGMDPFRGAEHDPATLHRYVYSHGDPSNRRDPSGLFSVVETSIVNSVVMTLSGTQSTIGFAVMDQVMYGGSAGLESIVLGVAGGAAIYGLSKLGLRLLKTAGFRRFADRMFRTQGIRPSVGTYGDLVGSIPGLQANHINQNAAFESVIPRNAGAAVGMRGNAFTEIGTPHYEFHRSLEEWWNQFRVGGVRAGARPTCGEYDDAAREALRAAGFADDVVESLAEFAATNRREFGLSDGSPVPRVPGRLPQRH